MTLADVALLVGGHLHGPGELAVAGLGSLRDAGPGDLVVAFDAAAVATAEQGPAVALVVPEGTSCRKPAVAVAKPKEALVRLLHAFRPAEPEPGGVHPTAVLGRGVELGPAVTIGPCAVLEDGVRVGAGSRIGAHCVIGADCVIGESVVLHARVTLYHAVTLGDRVVLHSGVVLGADGYGYQFVDGEHLKTPQLGRVVVEADVEIGANTTVDRATVGVTRVGRGSKIDNLVQIGHNCTLGRGVLLVSQAGIAGSCTLGDYVVMGGQVGVADHVNIGAGAQLVAQSGVVQDVPAGETLAGSPALPRLEHFRIFTATRRLLDWRRRLDRIEHRLDQLSAAPAASPDEPR